MAGLFSHNAVDAVQWPVARAGVSRFQVKTSC